MNKTRIISNVFKTQKGATLLEAIIALLIFSLGALGLAALQLTSLVSSGDSSQRTAAIWKAQEFADRIRANQSQVAQYITVVGKDKWDTIGKDVNSQAISCGVTTGFVKPKVCADSLSSTGTVTAAATCSAQEVVSYDVWDVFCNPDGGLAAAATNSTQANDGSVGVNNLEVALFENPATDNDDLILVLEWLSREAEANTDIAESKTVKTDLCGLQSDLEVASGLEVYCLRFAM